MRKMPWTSARRDTYASSAPSGDHIGIRVDPWLPVTRVDSPEPHIDHPDVPVAGGRIHASASDSHTVGGHLGIEQFGVGRRGQRAHQISLPIDPVGLATLPAVGRPQRQHAGLGHIEVRQTDDAPRRGFRGDRLRFAAQASACARRTAAPRAWHPAGRAGSRGCRRQARRMRRSLSSHDVERPDAHRALPVGSDGPIEKAAAIGEEPRAPAAARHRRHRRVPPAWACRPRS